MSREKKHGVFCKFFPLFFLLIIGCGGDVATPDTSISGAVSGDVKTGITITLTSGTAASVTKTDANGKFRFAGQPNGTYTITPSPTSYNTFSPASAKVTVNGAGATGINFTSVITLAGLKGDKTSVILMEGQTKQLKAAGFPNEAANGNVTWQSSDTSIVSVSSLGVVTAIAVGNATVTGVTSDGHVSLAYSVTVVNPDRLMVIVKADDLQASITSSFARLFEICTLADIPVSAGLVMKSLETATASQLEFLSNLDPQECELWIHGYTHYMNMKDGTTEFNGPDLQTQIATLKKCVDASKLYLKRDLSVIGFPGNAEDENTVSALDNYPSITTIFFQPLGGNRLVLPYLIKAEYTVGSMNSYDEIIKKANQLSAGSIAVLQIHPNGWVERDWDNFVLLIDGLRNSGAIFMTPGVYAKLI